MKDGLDLTYSLADQHFERTKSLGVLNFSLQFLEHLARRPELRRLIVFNNSTLQGGVNLPSQVKREVHDVAISSRWGRMYWDQVGVYGAAKNTGSEWLFLPKGFASFTRRCPVRLVGCLADVMPACYQRHYRDAFSRIELHYFLLSMRAVLRQAIVLFTTSDFSRDENCARGHGARLAATASAHDGNRLCAFTRPVPKGKPPDGAGKSFPAQADSDGGRVYVSMAAGHGLCGRRTLGRKFTERHFASPILKLETRFATGRIGISRTDWPLESARLHERIRRIRHAAGRSRASWRVSRLFLDTRNTRSHGTNRMPLLKRIIRVVRGGDEPGVSSFGQCIERVG
jgi:hypothetical protein